MSKLFSMRVLVAVVVLVLVSPVVAGQDGSNKQSGELSDCVDRLVIWSYQVAPRPADDHPFSELARVEVNRGAEYRLGSEMNYMFPGSARVTIDFFDDQDRPIGRGSWHGTVPEAASYGLVCAEAFPMMSGGPSIPASGFTWWYEEV